MENLPSATVPLYALSLSSITWSISSVTQTNPPFFTAARSSTSHVSGQRPLYPSHWPPLVFSAVHGHDMPSTRRSSASIFFWKASGESTSLPE